MRAFLARLLVCLALISTAMAEEKVRLRVGFFPNLTHAQGVIGQYTTGQGQGWFEQRLGPGVQLQWFAYNAGPSAMEAIFAGSIDLTYVGPSPAINAHVRSRGEDIRVVSGSAIGGAALLVRADSGIRVPADFRGKRIASPQLGNTQDVAARIWLRQQGFKLTQLGGEVLVIPTANADQLGLLQRGAIDGVWTVEPWVSRLEKEAGARIFLEQRDVPTTLLVTGVEALEKRRDLLAAFVKAHRELTLWIQQHPDEAQVLVQKGLSAQMKREIPLELIRSAWPRLSFTDQVSREALEQMARDAQQLGFLRGRVPLDAFIDSSL